MLHERNQAPCRPCRAVLQFDADCRPFLIAGFNAHHLVTNVLVLPTNHRTPGAARCTWQVAPRCARSRMLCTESASRALHDSAFLLPSPQKAESVMQATERAGT